MPMPMPTPIVGLAWYPGIMALAGLDPGSTSPSILPVMAEELRVV